MIQKALERLYQTYTEQYPLKRFVPCGLVNEKRYRESRIKVVWLLKEPYDSPENDKWQEWTLPEEINKYIQQNWWKGRRMWKVIGAISFGACQSAFSAYAVSYEKNNSENVREGLSVIGVTNLKKTGGYSVSNLDIIRQFAEDDKDLWLEELRLMQPDLVICGGTYGVIAPLLDLNDMWLGNGMRYATFEHNAFRTIFLDHYHPGYRISPKLIYAYAKENIEELRQIKMIKN